MEDDNKNNSSKWLSLFVIVIGTFMAVLDSSIVNIAIPKMMAVFGVSLDQVKWILTAYTLTLGAIVPLTGYLGDIFGSKKLFIFSLVSFTIGSFLCGLSWSNTSMIVFRIIQALGGGMIVPLGMAMIMQIFPVNERGTALGFWGIAAMAAPAIGPTLGGYILEKMDWRLIFYLNVPIGIFGVIMAGILLKDNGRKPFTGFDYIGFISSTVGIVSTLYVLGEGAAIDWGNIKNPILLTIGAFCMVLFVINELNHPDPLLDLRVLKNFDFTISLIIQCILTFALMGGMYIMPLFLQNIRGYTAMETGVILFPSAIATGLMMPISGKIFDKMGAKLPAFVGLAILTVSSYILIFVNMDTSRSEIILLLTIRGVGMGLANMPITTAGMNAVSHELAAKASALNNTIRQIFAAISVTIITTMLQSKLDLNYSILSEQVTTFNPVANGLIKQLQSLYMQSGYSQSEAGSVAISTITSIIYKQAYLDAINYALGVTTVAILVTIGMVLIMRKKKQEKSEEAVPVME